MNWSRPDTSARCSTSGISAAIAARSGMGRTRTRKLAAQVAKEKAEVVVLQEGTRRRVAVGLSRLRHDAWAPGIKAGVGPSKSARWWMSRRGLEVDEHSIVVARYAHGLSKFETRWGTFSDPWILQPQPRCGFIIAGTEGTVASYDYDDYVTVQTRRKPEPHRIACARPESAEPESGAILCRLPE